MVARVFPRRTKATPTDALAFFDEPGLFPIEVDAVHVSVTFTYDKPRAEYLAQAWSRIAPVSIGGPAYGDPGDTFTSGMYLRPGYVMTSRGCDNACPHCMAWQREGNIRELPIVDGWNVLDNNLLACSESHIRAVFAMLKRQKQPVEFTGGLEAAKLKPWHVDLLAELKPKQMFLAYDDAEDWEPLVEAAGLLLGVFTVESHSVRCYVLIGYPGDTQDAANSRLEQTLDLGVVPMAMLYRDEEGKTDPEWRRFQRLWARPAIIGARMKKEEESE